GTNHRETECGTVPRSEFRAPSSALRASFRLLPTAFCLLPTAHFPAIRRDRLLSLRLGRLDVRLDLRFNRVELFLSRVDDVVLGDLVQFLNCGRDAFPDRVTQDERSDRGQANVGDRRRPPAWSPELDG